jgi:hypothetical protein
MCVYVLWLPSITIDVMPLGVQMFHCVDSTGWLHITVMKEVQVLLQCLPVFSIESFVRSQFVFCLPYCHTVKYHQATTSLTIIRIMDQLLLVSFYIITSTPTYVRIGVDLFLWNNSEVLKWVLWKVPACLVVLTYILEPLS